MPRSSQIQASSGAGELLGETNRIVPAKGRLVGLVSDLFSLTSPQAGWLRVDAEGPVAGLVMFGDSSAAPNEIAALPAVQASSTLSLSHFRSDADWWTGIVVVNPENMYRRIRDRVMRKKVQRF